MRLSIIILLFNLTIIFVQAQKFISIYGRVTDIDNYPIPSVNIVVIGKNIFTSTDKYGNYEIKVPAGEKCSLSYSFLGYKTEIYEYIPDESDKLQVDKVLYIINQELGEVSVLSRYNENLSYTKLDPKSYDFLPNASGNIESLIKTQPGVVSTNELTSQYSVRGGNFDENLVYVNDIEIYRPFLLRSGQQEGLSFVNSDLVSSIKFSAGGFDAKYGDKMSSVLDIQYKKPTSFAGSFSFSFLGVSAHLEGISKNKKWTQITGFRYKTNQYLLGSLETTGEYRPNFGDFQTYITYTPNPKVEIDFLGNISQNNYLFVPESLKNSFGTFNEAYTLNIYYDGNELDKFGTTFGAVALNFKPTSTLTLKFTSSVFKTIEQETYDIMGQYFINQIGQSPKTMGDSLVNIGIGTFLNHARNYLHANVISFNHNGSYNIGNNNLLWGFRVQNERVADRISEWRMVDSAGYSIPSPNPFTDSIVSMEEQYSSNVNLNTNRFDGYFQNNLHYDLAQSKIDIDLGVRFNYWTFSKEVLFSPRGSITYDPGWQKDIIFRFATGVYDQPPFFKEMIDPTGKLNTNIKAQQSFHYVLSADYLFSLFDRPFKWTTELYYKDLKNLIPYKVDNVQIKYAAKNEAVGFARGIEMKINGEFVKGLESWASISLSRTMENIINDYYYVLKDTTLVKIEPGYYRRPTDQLLGFNLFFQDYLPNNPSYKVGVNLVYGTRMPFSSPYSPYYDSHVQAELKAYKRVDISFSKVLKREGKNVEKFPFLNHFKSIWISVEVFNLLGVRNVASLSWVKTLSDNTGYQQFIVENHLTGRRISLKFSVKF